MSCLLIHLQRKGIAIMLGQPASILFLAWNYKTQKCNCNIFSEDSFFLKQTVHMAKSFRSYNVRIILKYTAVYSFHMKLICMIAIGHFFYFEQWSLFHISLLYKMYKPGFYSLWYKQESWTTNTQWLSISLPWAMKISNMQVGHY